MQRIVHSHRNYSIEKYKKKSKFTERLVDCFLIFYSYYWAFLKWNIYCTLRGGGRFTRYTYISRLRRDYTFDGTEKKIASYFVPFMQGFLEIRAKGTTLNRDNLSMKWTEKRIRSRSPTGVDLYMMLFFNRTRVPQK